MPNRCKAKTEVYQRVVGFFRPVQQWNRGKKQEYKDRVPFKVDTAPNVCYCPDREQQAPAETTGGTE